MQKKIQAVLLALALAVGISLTTAPSAQAHACWQGCNTIHQYGPEGIGIIDWWGEGRWKWILPPGGRPTNGAPLYQKDVDGFFIGYGRCFQVWQSNDGYNYGYWGSACGPYNFQTTYWKYNRVNVF
jgi:hypothetical protein